MTGAGFACAMVIGVFCGAFVGVAWDRYSRRYDDHRPSYQRKAVSKERLARMHILDDEHTRRWDDD